MEDSDLGIYSLVIVGLFIMLGVATYSEFRNMNQTTYKGTERTDDVHIFRAFLKKVFG